MSPEEIKYLVEALKKIDEFLGTKPNEWLPVYAALGGAIAGAIVSLIPTFVLERYRENKHSSNVLAALRAEVSAFLEIIEHRKYHDSIKKVIDDLKDQPDGATYSYSVCVPDHYSRIYQANSSNIGLIDKTSAQKIVTFHQLVDAIIQDVKLGGAISNGGDIEAFKELEKIFSRAIIIGNELLDA